MKETDFYPEISEKFKRLLKIYLPVNAEIHYSYNKMLPQMIHEIDEKFGIIKKSDSYSPKLKLDILYGVRNGDGEIFYILFEVKYQANLALANYSQLTGYLQVAKNIKLGILFLVLKPNSTSHLSSDFNEIISSKNLPMEWKMLIDTSGQDNEFSYKTGISYYTPNNGIDWVDTSNPGGISSFEELATALNSLNDNA
jgi:hypothetical protein